jgi:hypothetical protein
MNSGTRTVAWAMVVVLAGAGGFFAKSLFEKRKATKGAEASSAETVTTGDNGAVNELRGEISDLRRQMGQVAGTTLQPGTPAAAAEEANKAPATEEEIHAAERVHSLHIASYATTYFNSERQDPVWGVEREHEIQQAMEGFTLPGFTLSKAECRTTICRVVISRSADGVTQNLGPAIGELPPFKKMGAFFHYADDKVVLFSPREGHAFPRDPTLAQQ